MRVLVACEESQVVCKAFRLRGHEAYSCDIQDCSGGHPEWHIKDDVLKHLDEDWGLMIAHPPCTYLASSGARWWKGREVEQVDALNFVHLLMNCRSIPRVALENPIGKIASHFRKPNQIIQPWQFGHGETKATCLWLKNLPLLRPTNIVDGRVARIHRMSPSENRSKERSKTYEGIAEAMAEQWGIW